MLLAVSDVYIVIAGRRLGPPPQQQHTNAANTPPCAEPGRRHGIPHRPWAQPGYTRAAGAGRRNPKPNREGAIDDHIW